ncbi:MAG: class I SAM-dependent methyltransferase [Cyanobacteria bacterium SZAS-4]|nr:class I SAM-dependent methyltransferase [Cyanobacteria bacterium SZAS-4]
MTNDKAATPGSINTLGELLSSETYKANLEFWQRAWNGVKTPYTQMPDLPYLPSIPAWLKERNVETVLDLGCGSGWLSIFLARQGFKVTGVDVADHAIDLARQWADQESLDIKFDIADIAAMNYPTGSFNAIVANSIFEHFTYDLAKETIKRLRAILKPGGGFIGCFDKVGTGPGEYFELEDGSHIYTDKARAGMLLRYFPDKELEKLFADWTITKFDEFGSGSRFICAHI